MAKQSVNSDFLRGESRIVENQFTKCRWNVLTFKNNFFRPILCVRFVLLLLIVTLAGCSRQPPVLPLAAVEGVVTYNGTAVPEALVTFHHEKGPRVSSGMTDHTGRFRLTTFRERDGAFVGINRVAVSLVIVDPALEELAKFKKAQPPTKDLAAREKADREFNIKAAAITQKYEKSRKANDRKLPPKYARAETSQLTRNVEKKSLNEFQIDLK